MKRDIFLFHCTGGNPDNYWFPWIKKKLILSGHTIHAPQFPSPVSEPSSLDKWIEVFEPFEAYVDEHSIFIGHSLGGIFSLRLLERLNTKVHLTVMAASYIGIGPVTAPANYEQEAAFSDFYFDWNRIKVSSNKFALFYSDNDPYIHSDNGITLAKYIGANLSIIPNGGHFNIDSGFDKFTELWGQVSISL